MNIQQLENEFWEAVGQLRAKLATLKAKHATIREANTAVLLAMLERFFSGLD